MRALAASLLALAGATTLLLLSNSGMAQGFGQPRQLFPQGEVRVIPPLGRQEEPQSSKEHRPWERPGGTGSRDLEPDEPRQERPAFWAGSGLGGIEVDELTGAIPDSIGILDEAEGGLGLDLWSGSHRDELIHLIRVIPDDMESPALRDLARRVLLSSATPPRRDASTARTGELLRARAERLHALGFHSDLLKLLQSLPREAREDPLLARLQVESALLTGKRAEACRLTEAALAFFSSDPFWQEAQIYCQISEGRESAAYLALSLLREAGDGDQQVLRLAEAALGDSEVPAIGEASALTLAYLNALDQAPPSSLIEQAPYAFMGVLARQTTLPAAERIALTERAVQFGLLHERALAEAYERQRFQIVVLEDPLAAASAKEGPEARALLYRAAWRATSPQAKLELLEAFRSHAAQEDLELAALRVASELLLDVQPDVVLAPMAPLVVESLLAAGRLEQASLWMAMLRQASRQNGQAQEAYRQAWPLARAAGIEGDGSLDLKTWSSRRALAVDSAQPDHEKTVLRLLLAALEGGREELAMAPLSRSGGAAPPSPSVLYSLQRAAAEARRGETALLVLQLLGGGTLGDDHPQALAESLAALVEVGLRTEARAIAVESLLVQSS